MKIYKYGLYAFLTSGLLPLQGAVAVPGDMQEQAPNILFIAIDDINDWTGFLGGHPQAVTPNMDRLAARGVNFTKAYCPAPGCSPSRNAILLGAEPFNSGLYVFYHQDAIPKNVLANYTSLPEFFKQHGYETFGSGKIHHRPDSARTDQEWSLFYQAEQDEPLVFNEEEGYRVGDSTNLNFSPTLNAFDEHIDYQNASFGVEVLSEKHDKPFFLAVGLKKPHLPFVCPQQFFDLYPEEVEPPRIKPDDTDDLPWAAQCMLLKKDNARFTQDHAWGKVRRAYLACISWTDYNVGRLLDALESSPYADNTIVVLWSDHGFALGEKKHFRKFALWEDITHAPFIIWDTREDTGTVGREVESAVSLINIYRTLADLSDLTPPDYVDGVSLAPQLTQPDAPVGYPAITSWGRGNYTVRKGDWRYIRYFNGDEELYLHTSDPDEWDNLAANPEYAAIKESLVAELPREEVPLIKEGMDDWSLPVSADRPQK